MAVTDLFQPNLVPSSTADSKQQATSGSTQQATSGSQQQASSTTGLPSWFSGDLLKALLPELKSSISGLSGQADDWADKNLAASHSASKNLLDGHLTSLMADLAKRGIGGSVSGDAVSNAATQAAKQQAGTDLGIMSQASQQKLAIPGLLGQLAGLGQQSTSKSSGMSQSESGGSAQSASSGTSQSQTSNPLAPYELYSKMLLGMM